MDIGKKIKKRREELGMTQDELATKVGYKSRSSINKIEIDGRGIPHSKIEVFSKALQINPIELMGIDNVNFNDTIEEASYNKDAVDLSAPEKQIEKLVFSNNLNYLFGQNDINLSSFASNMGVSEDIVYKWLSGSLLPDNFYLNKISQFFNLDIKNLTLDIIVGYYDREPSEDEIYNHLSKMFDNLTKEEAKEIENYLYFLISKRNNIKSSE